VLRYPELPLHNNAAELAARSQARNRDVSLQTKSEAGTSVRPKIYYNQKNWELEFMNTFMTEIAVQMNNLPLLS
jgi:hypothetical protein